MPDKIKSAAPFLKELHQLAMDNNISMAQLALTYMRGADGISSLVLGCETSEQLSESLSLFNAPLLNDNVIDRINEISQKVEPIVIRPWEWNK